MWRNFKANLGAQGGLLKKNILKFDVINLLCCTVVETHALLKIHIGLVHIIQLLNLEQSWVVKLVVYK